MTSRHNRAHLLNTVLALSLHLVAYVVSTRLAPRLYILLVVTRGRLSMRSKLLLTQRVRRRGTARSRVFAVQRALISVRAPHASSRALGESL